MSKKALVMAGGTGGHIFPGLALAQALREQGWQVSWLGQASGMEATLVPPQGFALETIEFSGVRGKGLTTLALLPLRLLRAFWQSLRVLRRLRPDVVIGMGGYITFPAGLMAVLLGRPLVLHEQNSVAGLVNRVLARISDRVFTAFPNALPQGEWVGNPLRTGFLQQADPATRFAGRSGPLRVLVVGGSLGAQALNDAVPQALALMPAQSRPQVVHQSGRGRREALEARYRELGVAATVLEFIDDMAGAYQEADLLVCRAGAMTVAEIAAIGIASVLVPYPHAVDDHQTGNARFLSEQGAAVLLPQPELTPARLAALLEGLDRPALAVMAARARALARPDAAQRVADACEEAARTP